MFSGIVQGVGKIIDRIDHENITTFVIALPEMAQENVTIGASVSIGGVCLTVVETDQKTIRVDAIPETLRLTTLGSLSIEDTVNIERSITFGTEIGGHILSGHIIDTACITNIDKQSRDVTYTFSLDPQYMKFIFHKGYIAINGCSLTVIDPKADGTFKVSLIPETLEKTTFGALKLFDRVNIEIDAQTQALVETVERLLPQIINPQ